MKRTYEYGLPAASPSTDASFPSRIPLIAGNRGGLTGTDGFEAPNSTAIPWHGDNLEILPYGAGNDDDTFDLRVLGWRRAGGVVSDQWLWVPTIICQLACTLGTEVGIVGFVPANTGRFCDIITVTNGLAVVPTAFANKVAEAFVSVQAYEYFEFIFDLGAGTNANVLYAAYNDIESQ